MNLFKYLFGDKLSPFDQIVEIFGGNTNVRIWNGTNFGPEMMFKHGEDPGYGNGEYYTIENPPAFVKISIGHCNRRYDDFAGWTYENVIELYVHQNTEIVWRSPWIPSGAVDLRTEKKVNNLLKKLKVGHVLMTDNKLLRQSLATFFEARPESRCLHHVEMTHLTESELERMKKTLAENEAEYLRNQRF